MFSFWLIVVLLIGVALGFLLPPLLKKRVPYSKEQFPDRDEMSLSIFRDQLAELNNDLKTSVITQDQYDQAKIDLERNILSDITTTVDEAHTQTVDVAVDETPQKHLVARSVPIVLSASVAVLAISLYIVFGAGSDGLDPSKVAPQVQADQHQESLDNMLKQLQDRLQAAPDDGEGWFMLARTYQFMKRYPEAVQAFQKAMVLGGGQDANFLATYADAVAMASGRQLNTQAVTLLEKAIQIDPNHVKGLWLIGTAAYQDKDYAKALKHWQKLLSVLPEGSDESNQIAANVAEVRSLLGLSPMQPGAVADSQAPQQMIQTNTDTTASSNGVRVFGTVSINDSLALQADVNDTLYVFARAAEGPRMPLAILRKQVKDLPLEFSLDDSLAMSPQMKLSNFSRVIIGARISKTGDAIAKPGDLEGYSAEYQVGDTSPVNIVIDRLVN